MAKGRRVRFRIEVATGGDPEAAVMNALYGIIQEQELRPGYVGVAIRHDAGCPCSRNENPTRFCTCEIVVVESKPDANPGEIHAMAVPKSRRRA